METDEEKLARLRGITLSDIRGIDRNVRACGLYQTEEEIARVVEATVKENLDSIRRYSNGHRYRNKKQLGR